MFSDISARRPKALRSFERARFPLEASGFGVVFVYTGIKHPWETPESDLLWQEAAQLSLAVFACHVFFV